MIPNPIPRHHRILKFALFTPGSSLLDLPEPSVFLHASQESGTIFLHFAHKETKPYPKITWRKVITIHSSDRAQIPDPRFLIATPSLPDGRTFLVFLDPLQYDFDGDPILPEPVHIGGMTKPSKA
jgi:hypothetical protein